MNESRALRGLMYPGKPDKKGNYPYCYKSSFEKIAEKNIPSLSWEEQYEMQKLAERRVLQAGVRLAAQLNQVFGGK